MALVKPLDIDKAIPSYHRITDCVMRVSMHMNRDAREKTDTPVEVMMIDLLAAGVIDKAALYALLKKTPWFEGAFDEHTPAPVREQPAMLSQEKTEEKAS
jgi:hypothetical protein